MTTIGELIQVDLEYSHPNSSSIHNVFYYQVVSSASDEEAHTDFVNWATDEWGAAWADFAEEDVDLIGVGTKVIDTVNGEVLRILGTSVLSIPGLVVSSPMNASAAAAIFAATTSPGSRGRKFVPGLPTARLTAGLMTAGALTDLAALLVVYVASWSADGDYIPGVRSVANGIFLPFTGTGGFDDIVDNQSRRRPDRGS